MKIVELIIHLRRIVEMHGDLPIVGGYLSDDRPPQNFVLIGNDGVDVTLSGHKPTGVFIE